ncbi:MAG: S41 family peptidase [Bacteroidales bacterium]|nr:S41 family peptidase [Bacteroidales bacterium]
MKRILLAASMLLLGALASAEPIRFAYHPSLSPDGSKIYFSYDGDICSVPVEGGLASTFISLGGNENYPVVSPDGKWIAFSSDIQGSNDVYVVSVNGGKARQLTFHEAGDVPVSWSADSKYIYFESTRGSARKTTFKVAVTGGTPSLMFDGFFNTVVNLVENPKTGEFLFNESMESISFPTRKRYVGDHNPNIKSWNPKSKDYKELTDYIGKDTWPMVDKAGNIYYVSDEYNQESNIVKYVKGGKPEQLTSFDKSIQYPSIAADGSAIVFLKEYQINVLDLKSGKTSVPEISVAAGGVTVKRSFSDQKPTYASVSPDGKKFALVIRGELYVADAKCEYLTKLKTPSDERVNEAEWSKDNKTIYYTRTNKGYINLYKISGDGSSAESAVYEPKAIIKGLSVSNKRDKLAFIDGNSSVKVCEMESGNVFEVAEAEFWSYQSYDISFSADDSYLAFEAMNRFESDIYVYSFKDKKLTNMTSSASSEGGMVFSPDGKYMYLLANLTATTFPRGGATYLYKLPLQKYDTAFKSDKYDKLFEEDKKDEPKDEAKDGGKASKKNAKTVKEEPKKDADKADKKEEMKIDFSNIFRRMQRVDYEGSQNGLFVFAAKGKELLLYSAYSNGQRAAFALDLKDPEAKPKRIKEFNGGGFFASDEELFAIGGGGLYKIDPNSLSASKIDVSKNVEKVLSDEFSQMFYECWGALDQNYYDVNFHGADWKAVREYYASLLPYVRTRDNLRTLLADMLGELNSSHLGFSSTGSEERTETRMRTYLTGIVFSADDPYKVERIIPDSPADKYGLDIKKNDVLVAVNGEKVDNSVNRESYFTSSVQMDELSLTFRRGGKENEVKVHTTSPSAIRSLEYREWEDQRRSMVEKKTDGRVAYLHMQAMGDEDLNNFLLDMHTYADDKDAIILDLRYNNGGNVHKEVIDFLRQQEHFQWSFRDFPKTTHPNVVPAGKPIVVLVNEHSLSDAEVTSNGIKTLGIAKLVGTETYRWIIFTSSVRLIDGSTCRMPAWGCYSVSGEDLEHIGVTPDIYVKNTFKDRLEGKDPQLDAAIKEVLSQLK